MSVLVTGAAGFVGKAVVKKLLQNGERVIAFDRDLSALPQHEQLTTIAGDLADEASISKCFDQKPDKVLHLAALPGGAAEADVDLSFRVNVSATCELMMRASKLSSTTRFVFSSTIAVFGDPLPAGGVDDETPLRPKLYYGMHKLMAETTLSTLTRRGELDGVGVRLPGILARPPGPSGMKSAFMSDVFYKLNAGEQITLPVSPQAQLWIMSVEKCAQNLVHALFLDSVRMPESRIVTLPAVKAGMEEIVAAIIEQSGTPSAVVDYDPDEKLEAAFGAHPDLATPAADAVGFSHDGSTSELVANVLQSITDQL